MCYEKQRVLTKKVKSKLSQIFIRIVAILVTLLAGYGLLHGTKVFAIPLLTGLAGIIGCILYILFAPHHIIENEKYMGRHCAILVLLSALLFALGLYTYAVPIFFIGFPDGHITDFGHVQKRLYQVHMGLSVIFGGLFFGLSLDHYPKRFMRSSRVLVIIYLILTASLIAIGYYYSLHLDDGIGG